jgi:hypothetical protein
VCSRRRAIRDWFKERRIISNTLLLIIRRLRYLINQAKRSMREELQEIEHLHVPSLIEAAWTNLLIDSPINFCLSSIELTLLPYKLQENMKKYLISLRDRTLNLSCLLNLEKLYQLIEAVEFCKFKLQHLEYKKGAKITVL